jgi:hypothetical protein
VLRFDLPSSKRLLGENHILFVHLPSRNTEGKKLVCADFDVDAKVLIESCHINIRFKPIVFIKNVNKISTLLADLKRFRFASAQPHTKACTFGIIKRPLEMSRSEPKQNLR